MDSTLDSTDVCNSILSVSDQHTIWNAAVEAEAGNHVPAERHRCFAGYDIGVMAAETTAGR